MADTGADGQDALRLLARAARALVEEGRISVDGLLPAYRAVAPLTHPGATKDALDVAAIVPWRSLGGDALLRARTIVVERAPPRSRPSAAPQSQSPADTSVVVRAAASEDDAGNALALALGLSLESAKLAHGLTAPADALRAAFATPNDARVAVDALRAGGASREVVIGTAHASERFDARLLAPLVGERAVYVVVGAGAWRTHDLMSPFARRLRHELIAAATNLAGGAREGPSSLTKADGPAAATASRDDDVYAAVDYLMMDASVRDERLAVERADGYVPLGDGAVAVRCEAMSDDVDRRCKDSAVNLKRAHALVVLVEPFSPTLSAVLSALSAQCRAVAVVVDASASCTPAFVAESAGGLVCAVDNAFAGPAAAASGIATATMLTSVPSLALAGAALGPVDGASFSLVQTVLRAQASGALPSSCKLAIKAVPRGDHAEMSRVCIDVLARLGPRRGR